MEQVSIADGDAGLVVRSEVAREQLDAETGTDVQPQPEGEQATSSPESTGSDPTNPLSPPPPRSRRFFNVISL